MREICKVVGNLERITGRPRCQHANRACAPIPSLLEGGAQRWHRSDRGDSRTSELPSDDVLRTGLQGATPEPTPVERGAREACAKKPVSADFKSPQTPSLSAGRGRVVAPVVDRNIEGPANSPGWQELGEFQIGRGERLCY